MAKIMKYVALLYSVVLGPGRRVIMADLISLAEECGFSEPRTVVATGNLIFNAPEADPRELESRLESAFEQKFGRHVDIIVREAEEWKTMMKRNPFPDASQSDASHVIVRIQRNPVSGNDVRMLEKYIENGEQITSAGRDIWVYFARDIGHSKLAAAMTAKRLGIGTGRNWNTVEKIGRTLDSVTTP